MSVVDFSKLYPDNRQEGETVLRQAQLVMLRMLKIIDYICRKHDISYWMCSGTLLGAVRHKGFIPWDDDLAAEHDFKGSNKSMRMSQAIYVNNLWQGFPAQHRQEAR